MTEPSRIHWWYSCAVAAGVTAACSSGATPSGRELTEQTGAALSTAVAAPSQAIATITRPDGHTIQIFAATEGGPIGLSEVGPSGTPRVLSDELVSSKKVSDIYAMLGGQDTQVLGTLRAAEAAVPLAVPEPPPSRTDSGTLSGPTFFTAADQSAFASQYCVAGWQCVQGYQWANSSQSNHSGRGYESIGTIGSEATASHNSEMDYWNGSSWQSITTCTLTAGGTCFLYGGNTGAPNGHDGNWYFKSEILSASDSPTVSLADHVYSPLVATVLWGCYGDPGVYQTCNWRPPFTAYSGTYCPGRLYEIDTQCEACSDDSCCNPP